MAFPEATDIARFRRMIGEPTETSYSDGDITTILQAVTVDTVTNWNLAAMTVWEEKAAKYAGLTDIVESGSERKLSQLHKQALGQVKLYTDKVSAELGVSSAVVAGIRVPGRSSAVWGGTAIVDPVMYGDLGPRA